MRSRHLYLFFSSAIIQLQSEQNPSTLRGKVGVTSPFSSSSGIIPSGTLGSLACTWIKYNNWYYLNGYFSCTFFFHPLPLFSLFLLSSWICLYDAVPPPSICLPKQRPMLSLPSHLPIYILSQDLVPVPNPLPATPLLHSRGIQLSPKLYAWEPALTSSVPEMGVQIKSLWHPHFLIFTA